jgi:hypothetical protein
MDRPTFSEQTDLVAWLILAYLYLNPDAKDTVDGVKQWWLNGIDATMESRKVQGALDHLVKLGWLVSCTRRGNGAVYALNKDRQATLGMMLERASEAR